MNINTVGKNVNTAKNVSSEILDIGIDSCSYYNTLEYIDDNNYDSLNSDQPRYAINTNLAATL